MGIKVNRRDDLDKMLGKFTQMDPHDKKRDKFLTNPEAKKKKAKRNRILKQDQSNK